MQSFGLDGFAHAAEAMVGKALGARDPMALRRAVRVSTHWAVIVALLYVLVTALFGSAIVALLTDQVAVRAMAADYMPWLIVAPVIAIWAFQLDGIFVGATHSGEMRNGMIAAFAVYGVAIWLAPPVLGNHGLWLALMLFMAARAVALAAFYPRIVRAAGAYTKSR